MAPSRYLALMKVPETVQEPVEEAVRHKCMNTNAERAMFAACLHTSGLDCAVQRIRCVANLRNEAAPGLCKPNAARVSLEQQNAKLFPKRLHPAADAGLAGA